MKIKLSQICFVPMLLIIDWKKLPSHRKRKSISRFGIPLLSLLLAISVGTWSMTT